MNKIIFDLNINATDYLQNYQGHAIDVIATSLDGRTLKFPAVLLREFVTHSGIQGRFALEYDEHNKCQSLQKLES